MTDNRKFLVDVKDFREKTEDQMLRVVKQSIQDVVSYAQTPVAQGGDMPVDTGFMRNSLVVNVRGSTAGKGSDSYILGLSTMNIGDSVRVGWTADYAIARHYAVGVGQGGGMWRDKAAQRWKSTVVSNAKKVR